MATKPERKKLVIKRARLSYPFLFAPRENKNDDGTVKKEYSVVLLLDKKAHKKEIALITAEVERVAKDKWNRVPSGKFKNPLRDGSEAMDTDTDEVKDGYENCMFITAKSNNRPAVVSKDPSVAADEDAIYGGMYANVVIDLFAWEHPKNGKGVSANLGAVQFAANGERFGAAPVDPTEVFDDISDEEEDEPPAKSTKGKGKPAKDDDDLFG